MNDCISRQALCEYALNQKDKSVTPNDIMRFPSVQPEDKCGECDAWNQYKNYTRQPEQRWIPCAERLPEDGTWNIFTDGETISVERYKMDALDHFFPQGRWFSLDEAIAWMPLPEPPYKGEKERRTDESDDVFE